MKFWIFMLICNLLIPVCMIIIGEIFVKNPPKNINGVYGYRTERSMRSGDAWSFAQRYCGKLWRRIGAVMLPLSVLAMLPLMGKDTDAVGLWGGILGGIQAVVLIAANFPVERALRKNFDENGKMRKENG